MAAGYPVVGANKSGIPDIISDGENGCLYNPDEEDSGACSLIEATKKLLGNERERTAMRQSARSEAERWGWTGATKQLRGYYYDVLDKNQSNVAVVCFKLHAEVELGESNDCRGNTKVAHVESFAGLCFLLSYANGTLTTLVPATCRSSPWFKTDSKAIRKAGKDKSSFWVI